jgi:hypothetical protein
MMRETDLKRMTRRSLLAGAGASVAGMLLADPSLGAAQSSSTTTSTPGTISASFGSLEQIDAGLLNVGYAEIHRTITGGVGHNLPLEAPEAFAGAVIAVNGL